jgi:RNA polymerase sigma factor for flagellar operon FliA
MTAAEMAYRTSTTDAASRDELITQELSQVYYLACRIRERLPQHVELDDLVSAGVVGLIEAAQSFDLSKNIQFRTFAKFRIRGAIVDSLRETDWGSRSLRRKGREIADVTARLQARFGRQPSESEIACEMQIEPDRLHKWTAQIAALQLGGQSVALSADRSESLDVIESAPSLNDPDPFDLCLEGERKAHLAQAIAQLSEREQLILSLYYREELTMKEIAKIVGVNLSRVSQIRQAIIVKLRAALDHLEDHAVPSVANQGAYYEHA